MGSPTSPALSNFCTLATDRALELAARNHKLTYTRYVDDLTFSSAFNIQLDVFNNVQAILLNNGLRINMDKVTWYGPDDEKVVTGLVLKEQPEVQQFFIECLQGNIQRLKHVLEFSSVTNYHISQNWINKFNQHVLGKLRFLQMVYGSKSPVYTTLHNDYKNAFYTEQFAESFNWNDIPYF